MGTALPHQPIVQALADRVRATLAPVAGRYAHCALVDFPNHSNVGDSAIWLGELAWLAEVGLPIRYRCDAKSYDRSALAEAVGPDGVILISGGGNLGDVWPTHQRLREAVIGDFPDRAVVQLPQAIHFQRQDHLERARTVFDAHPDLTILVRDRASLELARTTFKANSLLCPDMAFCLGPLARPAPPRRDIFWLRRMDREAVGGGDDVVPPHGPDVATADWLDNRRPAADRARRYLRRFPIRLAARTPAGRRTIARLRDATYDWQAERCLRFGCSLLSSGRVVITDRLHAHILSLLLGIPHVVLDNNYGKVRRFCETWNTASAPLVRWASAPADALSAARTLLDRTRQTA